MVVFASAEHHFHRARLIVTVLIFAVLFLSIISWFNSSKVDFGSPSGVVNSVYSYFGWIGSTGIKLFDAGRDSFSTIGNAIKGNSTKQEYNDGRK